MNNDLSKRELEVGGLIVQGFSNEEIAARLYISVGTTKSHVKRMLIKTDSKNRTHLAAKLVKGVLKDADTAKI